MPDIYTGNIKNMYISNLKVDNSNIQNLFDITVRCSFGELLVEKDSEFYINMFGNPVNFRYDNVLASRQEAKDFLKEFPFSSILFVDYRELAYRCTVSNRIVKEKKKIYKKN